jgi:hypothetical protein
VGRLYARHEIEGPVPLERAASVIAAEQSAGNFRAKPMRCANGMAIFLASKEAGYIVAQTYNSTPASG